MHDKERSDPKRCAHKLDRRAPRRWTAITGALSVVAMTCAFAEPAQASAEYYSHVTFNYGDGSSASYGGIPGLSVPQNFVLSGTGGAAYADASDTDGGTASVNVSIVGQGLVPPSQRITSIFATSIVTYRFSISGPNIGNTVPVLLSGAGASTGGWGFLKVEDGFGSVFFQQGNFEVEQILNLVPGWGYAMILYADAAVASNELEAGETREQGTTVDPTLTIQGADAGLYHFVGLPDATIGGLPAAVPEPATWAMMLSGFGLVGSTIRRRRASVRIA